MPLKYSIFESLPDLLISSAVCRQQPRVLSLCSRFSFNKIVLPCLPFCFDLPPRSLQQFVIQTATDRSKLAVPSRPLVPPALQGKIGTSHLSPRCGRLVTPRITSEAPVSIFRICAALSAPFATFCRKGGRQKVAKDAKNKQRAAHLFFERALQFTSASAKKGSARNRRCSVK